VLRPHSRPRTRSGREQAIPSSRARRETDAACPLEMSECERTTSCLEAVGPEKKGVSKHSYRDGRQNSAGGGRLLQRVWMLNLCGRDRRNPLPRLRGSQADRSPEQHAGRRDGRVESQNTDDDDEVRQQIDSRQECGR
jgi:hypothetical protein